MVLGPHETLRDNEYSDLSSKDGREPKPPHPFSSPSKLWNSKDKPRSNGRIQTPKI